MIIRDKNNYDEEYWQLFELFSDYDGIWTKILQTVFLWEQLK